MWKPASWWKKKIEPTDQQRGRADRADDLEEHAGVVDRADRPDADDVDDRGGDHRDRREQHDVAVGRCFQMSLANTDASATAVAAVPAMNASSAVYPVNQP